MRFAHKLFNNFYPRPPRGGRRCIGAAPVSSLVFLSTPSARRATQETPLHIGDAVISIHALREEGDERQLAGNNQAGLISIHALREEGDAVYRWTLYRRDPISIHALREEGDERQCKGMAEGNHFYPRPPRGGRPMPFSLSLRAAVFLSTPSARRATPARFSRGKLLS